jgi:peptidoglycan/xylan/chitin deacetylase (PgdA/CDA1 family)
VSRRRLAIGVAAAILLALAGLYGLHELSKARCFTLTGSVVCRVETQRPVVALTFDDGPTARGVDAVLPVLEAHGARATFFLIGREAAARPDLVGRIVDAGHEVANHSWSHQRMAARPHGFYETELRRTEAVLDRVRGPGPRLFRPPYGKKLIGLPRAVRDQRLTMVTWDVEEPTTSDPARYADEIVAQARPGSIILMHPMYGANGTARAALPRVLQGLQAKGLKVVPAGELIASGAGR